MTEPKPSATFYIDASYFYLLSLLCFSPMVESRKKRRTSRSSYRKRRVCRKISHDLRRKLKEIPKKCGVNPKKTDVAMFLSPATVRGKISGVWEIFPDYKEIAITMDFLVAPSSLWHMKKIFLDKLVL